MPELWCVFADFASCGDDALVGVSPSGLVLDITRDMPNDTDRRVSADQVERRGDQRRACARWSFCATRTAKQQTDGATYEIAETAAAPDTGAYNLFAAQPALPLAGPAVGSYQSPLPAGGLILTQDPGAAGLYSMQATAGTGATVTQQVSVPSTGATQNFAF